MLNGLTIEVRVAVVLLASVISAAFAGQVAAAPTPKACAATVAGAPFSYLAAFGAPLKGRAYRVETIAVTCSVAASWVRKLTAGSPGAVQPDGGNLLTGVPAGFKCEGKSYTSTRHSPPTISGECWQGDLLHPTKWFYWASAPETG